MLLGAWPEISWTRGKFARWRALATRGCRTGRAVASVRRTRKDREMSRSLLLRIAAALSLITAIGHTIGTFMPVPPDQMQMHSAIGVMKATLVPMPVGPSRSYMDLLDGNNLCTSVLLLLCAALLFGVAKAGKEKTADGVIVATALALAAVSLLSFVYFFPVPGAFTGIAAALALLARARGARAA